MSKKKADRLETIIIRNTVTIVTLLFMVIGATVIGRTCWKVASAGTTLAIINCNAQSYNEQTYKTDEMTDSYNEASDIRSALYQSEDTVVRVFTNLPTLPKLCVWLLSLSVLIIILLITILGIVKEINTERYFWKKKKERWERQDIRGKRETERNAKKGGRLTVPTTIKLIQLGSSNKWR